MCVCVCTYVTLIDVCMCACVCVYVYVSRTIVNVCMYVCMYVCTVAVHTDSWLLSVVFFHAAKLSRPDKKRLFDLCTQLPSLYETITGKANVVFGPKNKSGMKRPGGKAGVAAGMKGDKTNSAKKPKKEDEEEAEPGVHHSPAPGAKKLTNTDQQLLANLKGRHVQLYWPDDNLWYDAEVLDFNNRNKSAKYVSLPLSPSLPLIVSVLLLSRPCACRS